MTISHNQRGAGPLVGLSPLIAFYLPRLGGSREGPRFSSARENKGIALDALRQGRYGPQMPDRAAAASALGPSCWPTAPP